MKYDEAISLVVDASRVKMQLNVHKGDIERLTTAQAVEFAKMELDELLAAAENRDHEKIIMECGDVMNFLVSLAYNAVENYRRRKSGQFTT